MNIEYLGADRRRPFTPAVVAGDLVFVSGQASVDPATNQIIRGTFEEEFHRCVDNLEALLVSAGSGLARIVRVHAFVSHESSIPEFNRLYLERFPHPRPARTMWVSPIDAVQVELDCIAVLDPLVRDRNL